MAVDLNEVKINVRSLLTSSQKPLSILQLQKDYREQEGCNLPYRSLGFSSVIELLQNITDVVIVPPNPNESSMLSLVVGDKTNHLRMLITKQRPNNKRKKAKSNTNSQRTHNNYNGKNNYSKCNPYNKMMQTNTNNYTNNKSQNTRRDFHRSNNSSISYNQLSQSCSSFSKSYSGLNGNGFNQNAISSTGYVTDELRSYIERYILAKQTPITVDELKKIVKDHPDYLIMNVKSMQDLKNRVGGFLNINDTSVSLKNAHHFNTNIPIIDRDTDTQIKPSKPSDAKNVINSRLYECNDTNIVSELYTRLIDNQVEEDTPHSHKNVSNYEMNSKKNRSIENSTEFINMCKNQSMMRTLQSDFNSADINSDIAKTNLRKNIEYVKNQSESRKNKNADSRLFNENKSQLCSITMNGDNFSNNSNSFLHSTPKKNNNYIDKITLNGNQCIPELVRLNIARIFKEYYNGVNIENFKLIYTKLYHTILNPIDFGFTSIKQMLNVFEQIIEVRNNVLYTKNEFKLYANMDLENNNKCLLQNIDLSFETICTNIDQPKLSIHDNIKMLLVETYNPSLFYLQLQHRIEELDRLTNEMQNVFDTKNTNYLVKSEQILPGLFYATSYTSFSNLKQWYRVKVLREVNSTTVEVIHADYGTVDNIPKTELRFLNYKFCSLPCQAIHCCLTGYNELDSIAPEVTKAFLKIININKQVLVMVDHHFILSNQCQILHVTLFQNKSKDSNKLENINNELTIWHLNR
ncbi:putative uncharacterized protein DDB_G0277255 isoform X2 [Myzus persicae]|uniref:putative uncharacterized protein DDB_G0277255 isoform X2 n=1 Tax=Myzus persicae TaxID=13164 RepID=UPI000B9381CF|nr:putative uncharacterized protein DDB_G0277255 isoform X2 [Myzus persicae]